MPCCKGWKLKHPRPNHILLAEYLAQGLSRSECSRLTGISVCQVSRLRHSPLIASMVEQARLRLLTAEARARLNLQDTLIQQALADLEALEPIRDFSNARDKLHAVKLSLKLIHTLQQQKAQPAEEIHIQLNLPPGFPGPKP